MKEFKIVVFGQRESEWSRVSQVEQKIVFFVVRLL